jgi:hypothetical protein
MGTDPARNILSEVHKAKREYILSRVDVGLFYQKYFGDKFTYSKNMICPFHQDTSPSFSVKETGQWYCFSGCTRPGNGKKGGDLVHFLMKMESLTYGEALDVLWDEWCEPRVPSRYLEETIEEREKFTEKIRWLKSERGIEKHVLDALHCGLIDEGKWLTVPYINEFNEATGLIKIDIFRHNVDKRTKKRKAPRSLHLNAPKGKYEVGRIWPHWTLRENERLVMMEGHADTLLALSQGVPVVTVGSADYALRPKDKRYIVGKSFLLVYDMDDAGKFGAVTMARSLVEGGAAEVRVAELPLDEIGGKDYSDWCLKGSGGPVGLEELWERSPVFEVTNAVRVVDAALPEVRQKIEEVPFHSFDMDAYFKKWFRTTARVAGLSTDSFSLPKRICITCLNPRDKCLARACELALNPGHSKVVEFKRDSPQLMRFLKQKNPAFTKELKDYLGLTQGCQIRWDMDQVYSVRKALMADPVRFEAGLGEKKIAEKVVFLDMGCKMEANKDYVVEGFVASEPSAQRLFGVAIDVKTPESSVHNFYMTPEVREALEVFRPLCGDFEMLTAFYEHMSRTVTGIKGRAITHMAADLVFHSPVSFYFQGLLQPRGALDVMIFGDTRCGKNQIVERLRRHYGVGTIVSSCGATKAGLIGGAIRQGGYWGTLWGVIPSRHKDTVVIDEVKNMPVEIIHEFTQLRSEGVAQLTKINDSEMVPCSVGLIWLSNPREDHRPMNTFAYGVDALNRLWGDSKNVARLDYAHAVMTDDVSAEEINKGVKLHRGVRVSEPTLQGFDSLGKESPP